MVESNADQNHDHNTKGHVVLLHGLGVNRWLMALLGKRLQLSGYTVHNWGYGSVWQSLENLIPRFEKEFEEFQHKLTESGQGPLNIVAHSMGSIITRAVISRVELPSLKRVVMLSPPNGGSHVATTVGPYLQWLTTLVNELADHSDSLVNQLPHELNVEIGVIAAEWDHVVREESTHLKCETDHIIMPSRHTGLILRRKVADQIIYFLDHGRFFREELTGTSVTVSDASETQVSNKAHSPAISQRSDEFSPPA